MKLKHFFFVSLLCTLALGLASCDDGNGDISGDGNNEMSAQNNRLTQSEYNLLSFYVNDIVIFTYNNLANKAIAFKQKVDVLVQDLSDANVQAACEAWRDAREDWEYSEAFLFGTASDQHIDPHMDSWPLDNTRLAAILASNTFSSIDDPEERADFLRENYNNAMMGFHAAEYVIFAGGAAKSASLITSEQLAYLQAVALVLAEDCCRLKAGWSGESGLTAAQKEIYARISDDYGVNDRCGFQMLQAGQVASKYASFTDAVTEILGGCQDIINEVGTSKMEDPIAKNSVLEVESWYSWNSIDDFQNNIRGVIAAYTGKNSAGPSVQSLVKAKNSALDNKIVSQCNQAIQFLENIRADYGSYRNLVATLGSDGHNDANVSGAQAALADVNDALGVAMGYEY